MLFLKPKLLHSAQENVLSSSLSVMYDKMTTDVRYVEENSGKTSYTLRISSSGCGSNMGTVDGDDSRTELTNTIIIQNDKEIQEIWDVARRINCEWVDNYVKTVNFNPFTVGMLQAQEVRFQGDQPIECWMDLQLGKYPDISDINSIVKIGDPLSLLVFARDNDYQYDVAVKDCYAFAGPNYNDPRTPRLQLTDDDGCVLKDKLISPFYTAREDDGFGSTIVAYAHVNAFKFPDVMDVYMTCNVEICKGDCDSKCTGSFPTPTSTTPRRFGSTLFGEPIYTTKPTTIPTTPKPIEAPRCLPGSTDPSCNRGKQLFPGPTVPHPTPPTTTPRPKCFLGSKDPRCPKITTKAPKKCFPGSLDPSCPLICVIGSKDPRCEPFKCYPGSLDKRCPKPKPTTTPAPVTKKKECFPGSLNPDCQFTTKDGRYGSILFPATITTTPSTTTKQTTLFTVPITTPSTTTPKKSGGIIFSEPKTTKRPKPTIAPPRLKTKTTTTKSPGRGKQLFAEPKPNPEPSGGEWEGNPRFHAFHSYHYQRGDGRRSRIFGRRLNRKNKRTIRSVTGEETPRPLLGKVPLQLSRSMHVATPFNYPVLKVEEKIFSDNTLDYNLCLSSIAVMSFSVAFIMMFVFTSVCSFLYLRQKGRSQKK